MGLLHSVKHTYVLFLFALASSPVVRAVGFRVSTANRNWDYSYPYKSARLGNRNWHYGSATFYSYEDGSSGACGYPWKFINQLDTAAVPDPRYKDFLTPGLKHKGGAACGQCYLLKCINIPRYYNTVFCKTNRAVTVRITDYDVPGTWNNGRWPNNHFDLKPKTFGKIAYLKAGMINIKWRRTHCPRSSPKWSLGGSSNPFWKDLIIYQTPHVGSIHKVLVKPSNRNKWYSGKRSWGAHFSFLGGLVFDSRTKVLVFFAEKKGTRLAMRHQIY